MFSLFDVIIFLFNGMIKQNIYVFSLFDVIIFLFNGMIKQNIY